MAEGLDGIDRIAESVRDLVGQYANEIGGLAGDSLAGLTAYGPVVTPTYDKSRHAMLNVAVLNEVDLSMLRRLAREGARFGKRGIRAPIIMTPDYIRDSLDTFPLELIEIQRHHVTIVGDDHFEDLEFQPEHVRLQCEREVKILLIGLRQGLLAAGGREKLLGQLETGAADTLVRTMRGLAWLKDKKDADQTEELIAVTEEIVDRKLPGIRAAVDYRAEHGWDQLVTLYDDLESLRKKADVL